MYGVCLFSCDGQACVVVCGIFGVIYSLCACSVGRFYPGVGLLDLSSVSSHDSQCSWGLIT